MNKRNFFYVRLQRFWKTLGPGLITGASDDDPSAITTFSQAGAKFGLASLFTAIFTFPILAATQEMCARIGLVTNKGLAGVLKNYYPKWVLYAVIAITCPAFLLNIGADIAVLGAVGNLLFPSIATAYFSVGFTFLLLLIMLWLSYNKLEAVMKYVCLSLLVYTIVPFLSHQQFTDILKNTFIPSFSFDKDFLIILTSVFGAIISPYVFFWQTSTEVENHEKRNEYLTKNKNRFLFIRMRKDILYGAFFAVLIMYFIILTAGTVLHKNNIREINTVKDAAMALEPLGGNLSYLLFSIGVIGTGFIIIPVLSGSISYILSDAFKWKAGFNKKFYEAKHFYIIILIAMCIGLLMPLVGINPIKALLFTTFLYGITAPVLIGIILHISNNKKIMGAHTNGNVSNILGGFALALMTGCIITLVYLAIKN